VRAVGAGLAARPVTEVESRQVFDLPDVTVKVTGHQLVEQACCCGHRTKGAAPFTFTGARQFCATRSYLSTAAKHGLGVFYALIILTKASPGPRPRRLIKPERSQLPDQSHMHN
jgi:hypothetical protein